MTTLRGRRNAADYDVRSTVTAQEAADAVASSAEILRLLDALTPTELTRITDAMKLYEQGTGDVTWQL